jgi:hypothetical protein
MVKIHDGSLVPASELLGGTAEDDEGNPLKFKDVKDAAFPTYEAKSKVPDDTGRMRTYRFSFEDTNVTVHMSISEPGAEGQEKAAEAKAAAEEKKEAKETEKAVKETELKKSSSLEQPQQKLSPPDYRLRK